VRKYLLLLAEILHALNDKICIEMYDKFENLCNETKLVYVHSFMEECFADAAQFHGRFLL